MRTGALHGEQAPPLAIPLSFFATASLAAASAGVLLLWSGSAVLASSWSPLTLSLTHLGTLGFLTMVMMGALYQLSPVVAGRPVPWVRAAHAVHALLLTGVVAFCFGIASGEVSAVFVAIAVTAPALLLFLVPVGVALGRAPRRDETVFGMGMALACLLLAAAAGVWMAHGHGGMRFPGPRGLWIEVHLCVAVLGWLGASITAVSWHVLPRFYLALEPRRALKRTTLGMIALGVALPSLVLMLDLFGWLRATDLPPTRLAVLGALPAAIAVWGMHPATSLAGLARRRRRRADGSLLFWRAGLVLAPVTGIAAGVAHLFPEPRWGLLFGWLALWGWAGMIVHGMLARIVPFLVWTHRFAPLVGEVRVPSFGGLLPDTRVRLGFGLHLGSVAAGAAAIAMDSDLLARATGLLVLATAASLGHSILGLALKKPPLAESTCRLHAS